MPTITDILVHYPILRSVIGNLTTLDLFHLAIASKSITEVLGLKHDTFNDLKLNTLCDGAGSLAKSAYSEFLSKYISESIFEFEGDEELETLVCLVRKKMSHSICDTIFKYDLPEDRLRHTCLGWNAQPCVGCKIMVCEVSYHADSSNIIG